MDGTEPHFITTMIFHGELEVVRDWIGTGVTCRDVTCLVLFPAALYGQLPILKCALPHGDMLMLNDNGKSLLHVAVEGVEFNFTNENDNLTMAAPCVRLGQLEIMACLLQAGMDPGMKDSQGHTPLYTAMHLDSPFLEAAILLDICRRERPTSALSDGDHTPIPNNPTMLDPPVGNISSSMPTPAIGDPQYAEWWPSVKLLVEWAYKGRRFSLLALLMKYRVVDLADPGVTINHRPLIMDALRSNNCEVLRMIVQSRPANDVLNKVYQYEMPHVGVAEEEGHVQHVRETVISCLSNDYVLSHKGGRTHLDADAAIHELCHTLTKVILPDYRLIAVHPAIFYSGIVHIDLKGNRLHDLPLFHSEFQSIPQCPLLETLNISENEFTEIPEVVFRLPCLRSLLASHNRITALPLQMWLAPKLEVFRVAGNQITSLPCPDSFSLTRVGQPAPLQQVGSPVLRSTRQSHINSTAGTPEELNDLQRGFSLRSLDLSDNRLTAVPRGLECLAPLLKTLKLANNRIAALGRIQDYPSHLETLEMSNNQVEGDFVLAQQGGAEHELRWCYQAQLACLNPVCSHYCHTKLSSLKQLNLSDNGLRTLTLSCPPAAGGGGGGGGDALLPELLFHRLNSLKLSRNRLGRVPENVHRLEKLAELNIDGNVDIREIPLNLCQLEQLFSFKFEGVQDPIVAELAVCNSVSKMRRLMRSRGMHTVENSCMRMSVMGDANTGKTTLLARLQSSGGPPRANNRNFTEPTEAAAGLTIGIDCGVWECRKPGQTKVVTFYTWDFKGQEDYHLIHQCFLTKQALNVLVWNVEEGEEAIKELNKWLQNLQTTVPRATVVVVGSHLDKVPLDQRNETLWRERINAMFERPQRRDFPILADTFFVGCSDTGRSVGVRELASALYDIAFSIESCQGRNIKMKILEYRIPTSYDALKDRIREMADERVVAILKDDFFTRVRDIIDSMEEVQMAVEILHMTTGVVLHFRQMGMREYYVVNPQRWFEYCALVTSPIAIEVACRRSPDSQSGLMTLNNLKKEFHKRAMLDHNAQLICSFLHSCHVIHLINTEVFLIPAAMPMQPPVGLDAVTGSFPRNTHNHEEPMELMCVRDLPLVPVLQRLIKVEATGLIYRRKLYMPLLASGFWGELVSLFLQSSDFYKLIREAVPDLPFSEDATFCTRVLIGHLSVHWKYWQRGIVLFLDDQLLLEVHGGMLYEENEAIGRFRAISYSEFLRVRNNNSVMSHIPPDYLESISIVVPQVLLNSSAEFLSAQILTKTLEIMDDVLRNHCHSLSEQGIYSSSQMLHIIPCPLCVGDRDTREEVLVARGEVPVAREEVPVAREELPVDREEVPVDREEVPVDREEVHVAREEVPVAMGQRPSTESVSITTQVVENGFHYGFTVDVCIRASSDQDHINCLKHGRMKIECLAPDLVFSDFHTMKMFMAELEVPSPRSESRVSTEDMALECQGSYGKVVRRRSRQQDVAVKIFEQFCISAERGTTAELTSNYATMRYELNRLSVLNHPYVVKLIGVITNPHSFVLEWAPLVSLELQRKLYLKHSAHMCPTSLAITMLQVTDALEYLHEKQHLVHNDLRCSNILVFRFPDAGHTCHGMGTRSVFQCEACTLGGVLVKLTDLGICVNPRAYRNKMNQLQRFIPECAEDGDLFTDKVDIFMLGTCLYKLLSLRSFPSQDVTNNEFKDMIMSGKRPQFYSKDPSYPLLMYQLLQECWQHDRTKRPAAASLKRGIKVHTGLTPDGEWGGHTQVLLDSLLFIPGWNVVASCIVQAGEKLVICNALTSGDQPTTRIVLSNHQVTGLGITQLRAQQLCSIANETVTALFMTNADEIIAGCTSGNVYGLSASPCTPILFFRNHPLHSTVVGMTYEKDTNILIVGYAEGIVHIKKCTMSLAADNPWRMYCERVMAASSLCSVLCLCPEVGVLEVWLGCSGACLEVWTIQGGDMLVPGKLERATVAIRLTSDEYQGGSVVQMKSTPDSMKVVAFLKVPNNPQSIFVSLDTATKEFTGSWTFPFQVCSFDLMMNRMICGVSDGRIICKWDSTETDTVMPQVCEWAGHHHSVGAVFHVQRGARGDGTSSLFCTYVGGCLADTTHDFVLSIGCGSGYPGLADMFPNSVQGKDYVLNVWIV